MRHDTWPARICVVGMLPAMTTLTVSRGAQDGCGVLSATEDTRKVPFVTDTENGRLLLLLQETQCLVAIPSSNTPTATIATISLMLADVDVEVWS